MQTTNDTLTRQLASAETTARNAQTALRSAETFGRGLEKELAKTKQKVTEVRRAAEKDVRRRDETIKGLKGHLTARQRGSKVGLVGASVSITPGSGASQNNDNNVSGGAANLADPGYSLKQETTEFLTHLSQSLSDENDGLIALLRGAVNEVKGLLGVPEESKKRADRGQRREEVQIPTIAEEDTAMVNALPTSYEALAADFETVLTQLREVLTSPNFVPLEEVEVRDEEIGVLRYGWERMEARWREAVAMMEGWRKRIEEKGDTVRLEDLKMGLGLGQGFEDLASIAGSARKRNDSSKKIDNRELSEGAMEDGHVKDESDKEVGDVKELEKTTELDMFNLELPGRQQPLRETQANIRSPRRVSFMPSLDGTADEKDSDLDILAKAPDLSPGKVFSQDRKDVGGQARDSLQRVCFTSADAGTPPTQEAQSNPTNTGLDTDNLQPLKRRSSPHPSEAVSKLVFSSDLSENEEEQEGDGDSEHDHLSVQEKLRAAQAEAEAVAEARAQVAEKQTDERKQQTAEEVGETKSRRVGSPVKAVKRTRIGGRPKRRKSTLTPDELMGLLGD